MIYYITDKYKLDKHFSDDERLSNSDELIDFLNENYLGYIFVKNTRKSDMSIVLHVVGYKNMRGRGDQICAVHTKSTHSIDEYKIVDDEIIEVKKFHEDKNELPLEKHDILCKLDENEPMSKTRIRWWKGGKLETFEQFQTK